MLTFDSDFLGVGEHTYSNLCLHMLHIRVKHLLCTRVCDMKSKSKQRRPLTL